VGLARAGEHPDRLESRSREYHAAVRAGYLSIVAEGRLNSRLVAPGTIEQVEARVREAVARVL
jgi:thymidylate kinase